MPMDNNEMGRKINEINQPSLSHPKVKKGFELTLKSFFFIIFLVFMSAVMISVGWVELKDNKELQCMCNQADCICSNITIPENICEGVVVQAPQVNITHEIVSPSCILSGCNRTDVIGKCLTSNMEITLKIRDENGTAKYESLMGYFGNGIYRENYGGDTFEITIGED